jgi:hypothetical protein
MYMFCDGSFHAIYIYLDIHVYICRSAYFLPVEDALLKAIEREYITTQIDLVTKLKKLCIVYGDVIFPSSPTNSYDDPNVKDYAVWCSNHKGRLS